MTAFLSGGIPRFDVVTIYSGGAIVLETGDVVPADWTFVKAGVPCNIHRGSNRARDMVLALGIDPNSAAMGFFDTKYEPILPERGLLVDQNSEQWSIVGKPIFRNYFAGTAHVRLLLTVLAEPYTGLPSS